MSDQAANVSVQTDEFLVSPYEHLFPFVLPQWISGSQGTESNNQTGKSYDYAENPYEILDHYIEAAYQSAQAGTGPNTHKSSPEQEIKRLKVLCNIFLLVIPPSKISLEANHS